MITNERQYRITRKKAADFARAIKEFDAASRERADVHPKLLRAELAGMRSQLADLREELEEYEELKSADPSAISMGSFEELADGLIKARIASGLSQRALANRLEIKEQQVQRYEATRYGSASYQRLCEVARALGIMWNFVDCQSGARQGYPGPMIVPGDRGLARRDSGQWVFVDIGFSQGRRSCGIAIDDSKPRDVRYGDLVSEIAREIAKGSSPLNLLIEAPLSVAFKADGNPTGRRIEKKNRDTRYWYVGAGAAVLLATTHLLRRLYDMPPSREIRLFEGFVSFKPRGARSSHADDVSNLRSVAWGKSEKGTIIDEEGLKMRDDDILLSAFAVSGMDFGVPAVVVVEDP